MWRHVGADARTCTHTRAHAGSPAFCPHANKQTARWPGDNMAHVLVQTEARSRGRRSRRRPSLSGGNENDPYVLFTPPPPPHDLSASVRMVEPQHPATLYL